MQILRLHPDLIVVSEDRQRKDLGDIAELADSIRRLGQLQPIVVEKKTLALIAGERRLKACKMLEIDVLAVCKEDLSPVQQQLIELEENLKRKDMTWQERVDAICKIHQLYLAEKDSWTQEDTARSLGVVTSLVSECLTIKRNAVKDPKILEAVGHKAARNLVYRKESRQLANLLDDVLSVENERKPVSEQPEDPIICASFLEIADTYSGPKFNLIHCDFPYGVNMDKNALQDTRVDFERYDDSADLYWKLVSALVHNIERLASPECHIMFWYSMKFHEETKAALSQIGKVNPFPLIWGKSDNTGLLPDPQRGPRQIYETALLVSRGDRKIVRAVSNAFWHPANKDAAEHLSEKPVNVLLHFFPMLVDESTKLLDPTAGSGTSLIAAKKLGAQYTRGYEINQGFCDVANRKFWRES